MGNYISKLTKKSLVLIMVLAMAFTLVPMVPAWDAVEQAMASEHVELYVNATASDDTAIRSDGAIFKTLSGAVEKASDGDIIVLESDCSMPKENGLSVSGKEISIDLNGHTITDGGWHSGKTKLFYIYNGASLTIKDSSSEKSGRIKDEKVSDMFWVDNATLNISGGSFEYYWAGGTVLIARGAGKINISGGEFLNTTSGKSGDSTNMSAMFSSKGSNSAINILGGKFISKDEGDHRAYTFATDTVGRIVVSGGNFETDHYSYVEAVFKSIVFNGGHFKSTQSNLAGTAETLNLGNKVSFPYELTVCDEHPEEFVVKKIEAFQVETEKYATLKEAYDNSTNGDVIKLLKDTFSKETITVEKEVTLDLNGHEIECFMDGESAIGFKIIENGKLTIEDSSTDKTGKITSENQVRQIVRLLGGELVVNGGTYDIKLDTYKSFINLILCEGGKVTLNDGEFSVLKGKDEAGNIYSSVIGVTQKTDGITAVVNIKGGKYNACSEGNYRSRIFTSYKDSNYGFGTINVSGGYFNGDYDAGTEATEYTNITGGSFDRDVFANDVTLNSLINEDEYRVVSENCRFIVEIRSASNEAIYFPIKYVYANDGTYMPEDEVYKYNAKLHDEEVVRIQEEAKDWRVACRTKLGKKGIKVYAYLDGLATEELEQYLASRKYTVSYDWYRADGKGKKYKFVNTTEKNSYYNTALKNGKTYYYKCKITIYDQYGQIVRTQLTDCTKGYRTFRKTA